MFAFLRTANSLGVIAVSGLLALLGLGAALVGSTALLLIASSLAALHSVRSRLMSRSGRAHAFTDRCGGSRGPRHG